MDCSFAGLNFKTCIWNAAGPKCTNRDELLALGRSDAGAIVTKSCTLEFREGNSFPRYFESPTLTTNSTGLANHGYQYYGELGEELKKTYPSKPYIVSIAGLSQSDNLTMIDYFQYDNEKGITQPDLIELNLSCPNVIGKPQTGYDFEASRELLRKVAEIGGPIPIGLKLPPYLDLCHHDLMADVIKDHPISFLTCINSLGNCLIVDWESESSMIRPKAGLGGGGGSIVKPVSLANVREFSQRLPNIPVIGCGGVQSGRDAFEHILVGATAVQVGSQLMREGPDCFTRINRELQEIMTEKGYQQLSDFRGKLKTI